MRYKVVLELSGYTEEQASRAYQNIVEDFKTMREFMNASYAKEGRPPTNIKINAYIEPVDEEPQHEHLKVEDMQADPAIDTDNDGFLD